MHFTGTQTVQGATVSVQLQMALNDFKICYHNIFSFVKST